MPGDSNPLLNIIITPILSHKHHRVIAKFTKVATLLAKHHYQNDIKQP